MDHSLAVGGHPLTTVCDRALTRALSGVPDRHPPRVPSSRTHPPQFCSASSPPRPSPTGGCAPRRSEWLLDPGDRRRLRPLGRSGVAVSPDRIGVAASPSSRRSPASHDLLVGCQPPLGEAYRLQRIRSRCHSFEGLELHRTRIGPGTIRYSSISYLMSWYTVQ